MTNRLVDPSRTATPSPARPSRPCSEKGHVGTGVAASCCEWTFSPDASTATGSTPTGGLVPVGSYEVPGTVGAIAPVQGDDGWLLAAGRSFVYLVGADRLAAHACRGSPGRGPDERRRLRSAGPLLGGNDGRRPPRWRRSTLSARLDRTDRADAHRAYDLERTGLESRRSNDVPGGRRPTPTGTCGSRSTEVDGSTVVRPTVCCARLQPCRSLRARHVPLRGLG